MDKTIARRTAAALAAGSAADDQEQLACPADFESRFRTPRAPPLSVKSEPLDFYDYKIPLPPLPYGKKPKEEPVEGGQSIDNHKNSLRNSTADDLVEQGKNKETNNSSDLSKDEALQQVQFFLQYLSLGPAPWLVEQLQQLEQRLKQLDLAPAEEQQLHELHLRLQQLQTVDGDETTPPSEDTVTATADEPEHYRKLVIQGLTPTTTEEMLRAFYGQFGELVDAVVVCDDWTKKSKEFGFVIYAAKSMVDECQRARPHVIDGKEVKTRREHTQETNDPGSTNKMRVSDVRGLHSEEVLKAYFSMFGTIQKIEIVQDKLHLPSRGIAYVTFDDYDCVDQCVMMKSHDINGYRCDVKKGFSTEDCRHSKQSELDRESRSTRSLGGGPMRGEGGNPQGCDGRVHQRGWGGLVPRGGAGGGHGSRPVGVPPRGRCFGYQTNYGSRWEINLTRQSNLVPLWAVRPIERRGRVEFFSLQYPQGFPPVLYPYRY